MSEALVVTLAILQALNPPPPPRATLSDRDRFPSQQCAREGWLFARAHLQFLQGQLATCPDQEVPFWTAWYFEQTALHRAWDLLDDSYVRSPEGQVQALVELRWLLGEDDWWGGRMPAPVPLERYQRFQGAGWSLLAPTPCLVSGTCCRAGQVA